MKYFLILTIAFVYCFSEIPYDQKEWYFEQQKVNHFDPSDTRVYKQRYWSVENYFDKNSGSVLIWICGEYTCPGVRQSRLFPVEQAKLFNSLILVVEHRYYGKSMPFGQDSLKYENLKYLSIRQALDDLATFINYIKQNHLFGVQDSHPWIAIGGSYPGAMAAWFRFQYPHLVIGALASSAVVNSIVEFPKFDYQIYEATLKSGPQCVKDIQDLNKLAEQYLDGAQSVQFKTKFKSEKLSNNEFLFMFADVLVNLVQYGRRTYLCDLLASAQTIEAKMDLIANYVYNEVDISEYGSYYLQITDFDPETVGSSRQWMYQCCTEVGWWQTSPLQNSMRSDRIDINFYKQFCKDSFKVDIWPDGDRTNSYFGGDQLDVDNLILTNGVEDPWKHASVLKNQGNLIVREIKCDNCAHCVELYTPQANDAADLKNARTQINYYFKQWIDEHYRKLSVQI